MRIIAHMRVGRLDNGAVKIEATKKSSTEPLKNTYGEAIPTVSFAVEFNIDNAAFDRASKIIAKVDVKHAEPVVTVTEVEP